MKRFFSNFFYFGLFKGLVRPVPSQPVRALFAVSVLGFLGLLVPSHEWLFLLRDFCLY
jgi:hypothetical protein